MWWSSYIDTSAGANSGADARISSPFFNDKTSSCGILVGENKYLLLHGGEDEAGENIIPFCAPIGSPGATEPTPWLPGVGIPFPGGFLLLRFLLYSLWDFSFCQEFCQEFQSGN